MNLILENQPLVCVLVAFILGFIIGGFILSRFIFKSHKVGTLLIDNTDENTTKCSIVLEDVPFSELPENDYVSLRIKTKK